MSFQPIQCPEIGFFKKHVSRHYQLDTRYVSERDTEPEHFSKRTAIVWLTVRPPDALFRFAEKQKSDGYDIYVVIDANDYTVPTHDTSKVTVIQYNKGEAEAKGYKGCVLWVADRAASRCKAIYHFAHVDSSYDSVWMIEEDVFVPSINTIRHLDSLYPEGDLICTGNEINTTGELESWPWWAKLQPLISLPWSKSMIQAIRVSPKLFREIRTFVEKNNVLLFDEGMFTTLALQANLSIVNPPELSNLVYWNRQFDVNEFKPFHMYHPIKSWDQHNKFKDQMGMEHYNEVDIDLTVPTSI